jgi:predicted nuclease of restriction endonuclease-like (RecB) superfamily
MSKKFLATTKKSEISAASYTKFITSLKSKIRSAQIKASVTVNNELIKLYWEIGKNICEKQEGEGWGSKVLERVAKDLQNEFPGIEGFSRANMFRMKAFFSAYEKVAQAVRQFESLPN